MKIAVTLLMLFALQGRPAELSSSAPEARRAMHAFGACVADASPGKAARTLSMDFTTSTYRSALRNLASANASCLREGRMLSGGLLLAGAMAERLLEKDPSPLNARLARAAAASAPPARSPMDRIAICTVRSAPDEVARLFAAEVASGEEASAAAGLSVILRLCSADGPQLETTTEGLRSMLATAAFRSVAAGQTGSSSR